MNRLLQRKIKLFVSITLLLILSASLSFAAGRTSFPVLMELVDARALGLGGALLTENKWAGGTMLNPACAAGAEKGINASYASHMIDMWSGRFTISHLVRNRITLGGYITTFNYGTFDATELNIGKTGATFHAAENAFVCYAAGKYNEQIALGGAIKYLWGTISSYNASGVAMDIGLTYDPDWHKLKLAAVLRNFGKQLTSYGKDIDPLPTEVALGSSLELEHLPLTISAALMLANEGEGEWDLELIPGNPGLSFGLGGEFAIPTKIDVKPLQLRIGYRSRGVDLRVGQNNDLLAGASCGIGIPYRAYTFEYTFATMGALGNIHRFGLSGTI